MSVPKLRFFGCTISWQRQKLGELFEIASGSTPLRNINEYFDGGQHHWIKTTDLNNGRIFETQEKITDIALKKTSIKLLPQGSVLVAMYGGFNQIGRTGLLTRKAAINQALSALLPNLEIFHPYFLLNYLNYHVEDWKTFAASSRKDPNITKNDVKNFFFVFPKIEEQTKIANFLTAVDEKISQLTQKCALLTQYKKGVMQQIFSHALRLKDDDGREFPEWEAILLGEVSDVRDGTHESPKFYQDGSMFITSKNLLETGELDLTNVNYISEVDFTNFNKRSKVDDGDILFGMIGTIGRPVVVKKPNFAFKNMALIKQQSFLQNIFLVHYLKSNAVLKQFENVTVGNTQKFIALGKLRKLEIQLPSTQEQTKIANFLTAIDNKITNIQAQLAAAKQYKQGLLQQMFV